MKNLLGSVLLLCVGSVSAQTIQFVELKGKFAGSTYNNQGLALTDFNSDGKEDVFVSVKHLGKNGFYVNHGDFLFQDVTTFLGLFYTGYSQCSAWGDINNDGDPDLYVGNRNEPDLLFINNGDSTFTNEANLRGIDNPGNTSNVTMADFDGDAWLDIYVSNIQSANQLYINDGTGHFSEQAADRGVNDLAVGMGAVAFDYDNDGDVDIYQCHDAQVPYILYRNDGNGYFENVSSAAGVNYAGFGMGVETGDYNNDGYLDLYITNWLDNVFYKNLGDGTFENIAAGELANAGMGWSSVFADFNNDRFPDLYMTNDYKFYPLDNALFQNMGNDFFVDIVGWPWDSPFSSYGVVSHDFNEDGLMDLLIAHDGEPGVQLLQNTTASENHYIEFLLEGTVSNRDAIGSRLEIHTSAGVQYDQVIGNGGWASQNSRWIHFGLADQTVVDSLIIHWPSGAEEKINSLNADQKYKVREGEGVVTNTFSVPKKTVICSASFTGNEIMVRASFDKVKDVQLIDALGRHIHFTWELNNDIVTLQFDQMISGLYNVVIRGDVESCVSKVFVR